MKVKTNRDKYERYRSKMVSFRLSPEENEMVNKMVRLSGMTKQGYIRARLECRDVVVTGNPKVYKGLKYLLIEVRDKLEELIQKNENPEPELIEITKIIINVLDDMKTERK
jgi:hypothetical protein